MTSLPTGTITFLFTDIESSTRLLQQLGDACANLLSECQQLIRRVIADQSGQVVDTQGDGLFAAFPLSRNAVLAAVAAQRAIRQHSWREGVVPQVRVGLHTGEAVATETGYLGLDVHRAARICAAGHGGQILISDTTCALVARELPGGLSIRDLGEHRLKDLAQTQHLFQVVATDLPSEFPSLRTLDTLPNNLPIQLTSFIGRERERAEVKRLLATTRLLTLTGAGGAGKTRLALQVAAEILEEFPEGVWVTDLAPVADPALVIPALATAVGLRDESGRSLLFAIADYLRAKQTLVVLDNCEHLIDACAQLAEALLRSCPQMRILATSREALNIPGETAWRVPSLSLPDPARLPSTARLTEFEAVGLFVERTVAGVPAFTLTDRNAPAVVQLCHRLDGMPLAIELAAARVKVLTPEQIASRLDDRFRLLNRGGRTTLPRHQTLRAVMDWSYGLLTEKERILLRRLSVFAGGWTLEAAETVCSGNGVEPAEMLDLLNQLIDKSLLIVEMHEGEAIYRLLETVREYGRIRLRDAGEAEEVARRHRDWYLALVERAEPELRGPNQIAWLDRLEGSRDNLRTALEWSKTEAGGHAAGLRLTASLYEFWEIHGHFAEARAWLDEMLSLNKEAVPVLRAKALNRAGHLAYRQGDDVRVATLCGEALALSEAEGDKKESAQALHYLAHAAEGGGDHRRAGELLESSVALHRAAGSTWELGSALHCSANAARFEGNYRKAAALFEEALTIFHNLGDRRGRATTLHNLGYVALRQGDHQRAQALFRESLKVAGELGDRRVLNCLTGLASASAEAKPEWATRLFAAATALMSAISVRLEPVNRRDFDHYLAVAKGRLGERAFGAAWTEGATMTVDQATAYALVTQDASSPVDTQVKKLTAREREVTALIARGLTNRAIASRLMIAERTVDAHVEHILNKLGFNSRTQIAAWAVETGLHKSSLSGIGRSTPGL